MVGWHHSLDGHEFEKALRVGDGQGSLACCRPWGCKESDRTKLLSRTEQQRSSKVKKKKKKKKKKKRQFKKKRKEA